MVDGGIRKLFFDSLEQANLTSKSAFDSLDLSLMTTQGLDSLSQGERKQLFAEYQTYAAKKEREEERLAKKRAREEFEDLLEEWSRDGALDPDISFNQVASVCFRQSFWYVLDLGELEDIFLDFISSYETRKRNVIREHRYEQKRQLYRLAEERWPASAPSYPRWSDFTASLSEAPSFLHLDNLDRFEVYEDLVRELNEWRQEQRRRKEKREGRKKRESFLALLEKMKETIMHSESEPLRWERFQPQVASSPEYYDLIGTRNSSQPYDLFVEQRSRWKHAGEIEPMPSESNSLDDDPIMTNNRKASDDEDIDSKRIR